MWGRIVNRARRRIVSDFVAAKATAPGRAIAYDAPDCRAFRRLLRFGAIVGDGAGRYHLDARRLGLFRGMVRKRAAATLAGFGVIASAVAAAFTMLALAE